MITKHLNGISWLEFELLAHLPIINACSMREGGLSSGVLKSLNLGNRVGDLTENVKHNKEKLLHTIASNHHIELHELITARLTHGKDITAINTAHVEIPISDGLSTNVLKRTILVTQADCQGAIFYDPVHHAVANIHCGWRSNVQNIYLNTVLHMQKTYHSNPKDLLVCISPSLGPKHAEFINYETEWPEEYWKFQITPYFFDLWAISEWQLLQAGILKEHIEIARIDTYEEEKDYFSHRRHTRSEAEVDVSKKTQCGRQGTICALI